jgi:GNAT superfamily N-acetyltransferase
MDIEVRQAQLVDKAAIFEFLAQAYGERSQYKFPERWEWAYEHNPFWDKAGLPLWIAVTAQGKIVGQSGALIEPLWIRGSAHRASWGVDFFVLTEFRGMGLGSRLQTANHAAADVFISLSMAAPAARIKAKMGMQSLDPVPAYLKILNHEPASLTQTLAQRLPGLPTFLGHRLSRPLAALLSWRGARRDRQREKALLRVSLQETFGAEFDALWNRLSTHYQVLIRRDAAYLNWKYGRQPHIQPQVFLAWREDLPAGYLIVRQSRPPERSAGILLDLFCAPDDSPCIDSLLTAAIQHFRAHNVVTLRAASSQAAIQTALIDTGFKRRSEAVPMVAAQQALPESGWLLSKGDHDWDQYPLA